MLAGIASPTDEGLFKTPIEYLRYKLLLSLLLIPLLRVRLRASALTATTAPHDGTIARLRLTAAVTASTTAVVVVTTAVALVVAVTARGFFTHTALDLVALVA